MLWGRRREAGTDLTQEEPGPSEVEYLDFSLMRPIQNSRPGLPWWRIG